METDLTGLLPFFDASRRQNRPLALATLIATQGSTYRKSGAQMLIDQTGNYVGLLSGGCLEGDLREHAGDVVASGTAQLVTYDMRGPDEELWGLGSGCEGAMEVLLQRVSEAEQWLPLASLAALTAAGERAIATHSLRWPSGHARDTKAGNSQAASVSTAVWRIRPGEPLVQRAASCGEADWRVAETLAQELAAGDFDAPIVRDANQQRWLALPYAPAPALLLLGAGPDARPLAELAWFLGWRVTVYDHRASLVVPGSFPESVQRLCGAADALLGSVNPEQFAAAVIMSHHLSSDRQYLRALASAAPDYTGLLGPATRREKLLRSLGENEARALRSRLRAPVGLELGGRSPEAIALGIMTDIHAHRHRRDVTVTLRPA